MLQDSVPRQNHFKTTFQQLAGLIISRPRLHKTKYQDLYIGTIIQRQFRKDLKLTPPPNTDGWGNKLVTVFAFAPAF
jgi:hypothetical protein